MIRFFLNFYWCKLLSLPPLIIVCVWEGRGGGGSTWGTLGFRGHYLPSGRATGVVVLSLKVGMAKRNYSVHCFFSGYLHCTICTLKH